MNQMNILRNVIGYVSWIIPLPDDLLRNSRKNFHKSLHVFLWHKFGGWDGTESEKNKSTAFGFTDNVFNWLKRKIFIKNCEII